MVPRSALGFQQTGGVKRRQPFVCFNCNEEGHLARECDKPKKMKLSGGNQARNRDQPATGANLVPLGGAQRSNLNKIDQPDLYPSSCEPMLTSIRVGRVQVSADLDTGACSTYVDHDFFVSSLAKWSTPIVAPTREVISAGMMKPEATGTSKILVQYTDSKGQLSQIQLSITVIRNLGCKMLLGRDFIYGTKMKIDTGAEIATCYPPSDAIDGKKPLILKLSREASVAPEMGPKTSVKGDGTEAPNSGSEQEKEQNQKNNHEGVGPRIEVPSDPTATCDDIWGEAYQLSDEPFADDQMEDRENPYVDQSNIKLVPIGTNTILVGIRLLEEEIKTVAEVVTSYIDRFAFNGELGDCPVLSHEIRTGAARPIHSGTTVRSNKEQEKIEQQIEEWLRQGVIEPARSPWCSRVVTVKKKDNTLRCCIDYRGVNGVTERDVYPLPTLSEILSSLNGQKYFTTLDLNQGYMQIRMSKDDKAKTGFIVRSGFYQFLRMPFGLTNAPATFQRVMDQVLGELKWNSCLVYLDDIIVFGTTLDEHNERLATILGN